MKRKQRRTKPLLKLGRTKLLLLLLQIEFQNSTKNGLNASTGWKPYCYRSLCSRPFHWRLELPPLIHLLSMCPETQPFFQPTHRNPGDSSPKRTGPDISAAQQPSAGKLTSHSSTCSSAVKHTGPDSTAAKQKSTGKLKLDQIRPKSSTGRTGPDTATVKSKSTGKPHIDSHRPSSRPVQSASTSPADPPLSDRPSTDRPQHSVVSGSESPSLWKSSRKDIISSRESEVDTDLSDRPPVELFVEEGELSDEQELTEHDLPTSEEQTYRETMRGIRSFMGWSHVPDADSTNPSDDNPFAGPKTPAPSKVSVHMPTEEWLCKKLSRLNITLVEGYPSRTAEAASLPMDHFLKAP